MDLQDIRKDIDRIDGMLVPLLIERMNCSKKVAEYKKEHSLPVYDAAREQQLLEKVKAAGETYETQIEDIYNCILRTSRELQR